MKSKEEIQLAILTLTKDKGSAPHFSMFGDDNHKVIDMSIELLEDKLSIEEVEEMRDHEELTDSEYMSIDSFNQWKEDTGEELTELLWDVDNLVTELPSEDGETCSTGVNMCSKACGECPFRKNSMAGWLADYSTEDIVAYMRGDVSFPCHMTMTNDDMSPADCKDAIERGEMKLCRGYVEMLIKSAKMPSTNQQLLDAMEQVRKEGLSDNTMSIFEFIEHHKQLDESK